MPVPLVDEAYQRVSFVPIQNIICRCTPGVLRFLMMIGIGNRVQCTCGAVYHISGMGTDGQPIIVVEAPMPGGGSLQ